MGPLSKLTDFFADLKHTRDINAREGLIDDTGIKRSKIDVEGTPSRFSNKLMRSLHQQGQEKMVCFLNQVLVLQDAEPGEWFGVKQRDKLRGLLGEIEAITPAQWRNIDERLPCIYISHHPPSAGSASTVHKFLDKICVALKADGFEVLADTAPPGDAHDWRAKLFRGLGRCDGGLVLLSDQAVAETDPIFSEAAILRWRHWREKDFVLLPVYLGELLPAWLKEDPWTRLDFVSKEIIHDRAEDKIITAIKQRLQEMKQKPREMTWLEALEVTLSNDLKVVPEEFLDDALNQIGRACEDDRSQLCIQRQVARALLRSGLDAFPTVIDKMAASPLSPKLEEILKRLASMWIDLRAAGLILKIAAKDDAERAFCVNGDEANPTGEWYLWRANPKLSWKFVHTTKHGIHEVLDEIRYDLIHQLVPLRSKYGDLELPYPDEQVAAIDKNINRALRSLEKQKRPVFVFFPPNHADGEKLKKVRDTFPALTFFLLLGAEAKDAPFDFVEFLEPRMQPSEEADMLEKYFDMQVLI